MRQVLVKILPPATFVSSGTVISATKDALLVQSGGLVGATVPTVGVALAGVPLGWAVSVSVAAGAAVVTAIAAAGWVSVAASVAVGEAPRPLQADKVNTINRVTMNSFLVIRSLLCSHVGSKLKV